MCFRLDVALYKRCYKDAERFCYVFEWVEFKLMYFNNGFLILSCFYRFMKENDFGYKVRFFDND